MLHYIFLSKVYNLDKLLLHVLAGKKMHISSKSAPQTSSLLILFLFFSHLYPYDIGNWILESIRKRIVETYYGSKTCYW